MKRWAVLTALLYALALMALTAPALAIAFGGWGKNGDSYGWHRALNVYSAWGYWLWLAVLLAGQSLLLLLPIRLAERRLPARRPLPVPVVVTAFFLASLCFAGLLSILMLYFKEDGFNFFGYFLAFKPDQVTPSDFATEFGAGVVMLAFWIIWAVIFRRFAQADAPDALLKRLTRWLLRGSILELLVAVPSHIIVRRRGDCCAPLGTFWGIVTGISVMLLCFGPGVYFLFVERCRRLQPKPADANNRSGRE
jgi:hypothetical protein